LRKIILAHLVLVFSVGLLIYQAKSDLEVSAGVEIHAVSDFNDPLSAEGAWVDVGGHGRCWRPRRVAEDWRPYCEGTWVWTDCGWYWESDEPWSWACYHYGTWLDDPSFGWCWVPGIEWAPAWVVWREGAGFVGWAPCAPAGVTVAPAWFAFVDVNHFSGPIRRASLTVSDTGLFQRTSEVGGARRERRDFGGRNQNVVINQGPNVATVEKASGRRLAPVSVQDVVKRTPAPANFRPAENRRDQESTPQPSVTPAPRDSQPAPDRRTPEERSAPEPQNRPVETVPSEPRRTEPATPPQIPDERQSNPGRGERPVNPPPETKPATPRVPDLPANPPRGTQPVAPPREERPATPGREERPSSPIRDEHPAAPPREEQPATPPRPETPPANRGRDQQGKIPYPGDEILNALIMRGSDPLNPEARA